MLTVNFQSIKSKQGQVKNLVESTQPDIVLGTETWIDPTITDNQIFPPNYHILVYRNDRNLKGGVLTAIKNDHLSTPVPELQTNCEIVQLPSLSTITGVVTQGKDGPGKEWTTKYRVLYSEDCKRYNVIHPVSGGIFHGNTDENSEVTNMFSRPVKALCVKINPEAFNNRISMRIDLIGCYRVTMQQSSALATATTSRLQHTSAQTPTITPTKTTVTLVKPTQGQLCHNSLINNSTLNSHVNLTASSIFHNPTTGTTPSRAILDTKTESLQQYGTMLGGWTPAHDGKQYIQATFSKPQMIDKIITQGVDNRQQWVTKFSIQYSQDCVNWQQLQNPKEFNANTDDKTKVTNKFGCPVFAKCVRVYPLDWHNHSGLRFDLIGCEIIDVPHSNLTLQKTSLGSSASTMSTSSTSTLKLSNITTASTTITSTKITRKTTIASPLTTANPKVSQSTTIKPTTLTSVTHKIFPTGKASNYDTRDPLDCKRALLIVPCTNPIVKKHCFYSCNPKQGNILLSSTNTTPFRQTTIITSQQTTSLPVAVSNVQITHVSSVSTHMSAANIYVSLNSQSSLSNMLSINSNTRSNSLSAIQSTPTSMLPSSISIGVSSFKHSNIPHTSTTTQNTIVSSFISPMSSAIALMSVTPTNVVSSSVTHVTHNVLPTGQASMYNPLDPLDCKRSLLMFSCSIPLVAKHCHYSCSTPSFKLPSFSIFHSSASGVALSQNSDKTSSIAQTSFLNGIQSTQLSQTQINPSRTITNLYTTVNQKLNRINPSSLTSAIFHVTSMVNPSSIVHSNSAIVSPSISSNPSINTLSKIPVFHSSTTPYTSTVLSSNTNLAQMSSYTQASRSFTISMVQSSISSKPLSLSIPGSQTTALQSAFKDMSVTSAMITASMPQGSTIIQFSSSLSFVPSSTNLQNVQGSDKPSSTVVNPSSVLHQHYFNSLNINTPSSIIQTTQISNLPPSGVASSLLYQSSSNTVLYSSVPQSLVTSLIQASSADGLSSGVTDIFTSSVIKGSSKIHSFASNSVSSFSSGGITFSRTTGSSSLLGKGNPVKISTMYASSGHYTRVVSATNSLLLVQSSNIVASQFATKSFLQSSVSSVSVAPSQSGVKQLVPTQHISSIRQSSLPLSSVPLLSSFPFIQSSILHSGYQSSLGHLSSSQSLSILNPGMNSVFSSLNTDTIPVSSSQNQDLTTVPSSLNQDSSLFLNPSKSSIFASLNPSATPGLSSQISDLSIVFSSPNHAMSSAISSIHPIMLSVPSSLNTGMVSASSNLSHIKSFTHSIPNPSMSSALSNINPSMSSAPSSIYQSMTAASSTLNQGRIFIPSSLNPSMSSELSNINPGMASASTNLNLGILSTPSSINPSISFAQSSQSPVVLSAFSNVNSSILSTQLSVNPGMSYTTSIQKSVMPLSTSNINPSTKSLSSSKQLSFPGSSDTITPLLIMSTSVPISSDYVQTMAISSSASSAIQIQSSNILPSSGASFITNMISATVLSTHGPLTMSRISSIAYQSNAISSTSTPVGSYSAFRGTSSNSATISSNVHVTASSQTVSPSFSTSMASVTSIDSSTFISSSTQLPSSLLLSSEISTSPFWSSVHSLESSVPLTSFVHGSSSYKTTVPFSGYQTAAMPFLSSSVSSNSVQMSFTCVPVSSESSLTISASSNILLFSMSPSIILSSGEHSSDFISTSDISSSQVYSPVSSAVVSMTCYNVPVMSSYSISSALHSVIPTLPSVQMLPKTTAFGFSVFSTKSPISHTISHSMSQLSVSSTQTLTQTSKTTTQASKQLPTVTHGTNVIIPTGVASIYDSRDPVDCKRSLKIAPCSFSVVAKHCFFSCSKQSSTAAHPISPGKLSLPTGSSTMAKSKIIFQSPTSTFSKAISSATKMINFSTSTKPNLSKSSQSLKSIQISTSTTKPLTSMSTTKPSTIMSTTKPSTYMSTTKPSTAMSTTKPSTSMSTTKPSTSMSTTKPSTTMSTTKPSTIMSTTKPSTFMSTTKPSTAMSTTKPSTSMSTTKPSTSMSTTKPSTIMSTTKPSTSMSTTKPSTSMSTTKPSTSLLTTKPRRTTTTTTRRINHTIRSLYDFRDPKQCMQLITWIQCTDFYYGSMCKYSCGKFFS
ncbi:unnamed protein product [Mytilus coruscus]|uniref:F5/8 type C domain-containing protein n=1 Tax=Mytilus coruscus TaxID=42192 RepID=A0A6J8D898_MYTCO|nr:unnamed protein product [Mytilus coruscus]